MTEELLTRLEKLEADATCSPWHVTNSNRGHCVNIGKMELAIELDSTDAELIAEMRNALPKLLREIRERRTIDQAVIKSSWGEE